MSQDDRRSRERDQSEEESAAHRRSTAQSLLEFLRSGPKWAGDDMERCLAELKATRGGFWFDEEGYLVPSPQRVVHIETASGEAVDIDVTDVEDIESIGKPWYGPESTGESLLELIQHLPDWAGDDADESLEDVLRSRTQARF
ncbi:MAG TPA: hypothetical protein VKB09_08470 [Thermomicrobiales bacterium]|nr:hypothetical protein [Thermomicrobiales bacterium]